MVELNRRNIILGVILTYSILALPSFFQHYSYFVTGQVNQMVEQGNWQMVLLNVAGFLLFLIPLNYRRKADWKSYGVYTAFIVSLFIEMYGIPLTIYLSSSIFSPVAMAPDYLVTFTVLGSGFGLTSWMLLSALITVAGMVLVGLGWATIYRAEEDLVTSGIYNYSRHPQYIGIFLIAFGWFIGWPTLLTTLLLPVLTYTYYKLSLEEEQEVMAEIGEEKYMSYAETTPRFI